MTRIERNDANMVIWLCNSRLEIRISAEERRTRLKFKSTRECLQERRLQWFDHRDKMKESAWSSKCRTFKIWGSFTTKENME